MSGASKKPKEFIRAQSLACQDWHWSSQQLTSHMDAYGMPPWPLWRTVHLARSLPSKPLVSVMEEEKISFSSSILASATVAGSLVISTVQEKSCSAKNVPKDKDWICLGGNPTLCIVSIVSGYQGFQAKCDVLTWGRVNVVRAERSSGTS